MKISISKEAKIGLSTIVAIVLLIWGFNFLKGKNIFKSTNVFNIIYPELSGLKESNYVLINGFKVGQVTELKLGDGKSRKVYVKILIEKDYEIPVGSIARLSSIDFMGTKAIEMLLSDESELHQSGDTLIARVGEGIMDKVAEFEEQIMQITIGLKTFLDKLNNTFTDEMTSDLKGTIDNLNNTTGSLEIMMGEEGEIKSIISRIDDLLYNLKATADKLPQTIGNVQALTDSLKESNIKMLINNTTQALENMNNILVKIDEGTGSAGKLVNNDSLYANLSNSARELELLLKDLRENPKRYVHISVFGRKEK